jgi:hypothetical protein
VSVLVVVQPSSEVPEGLMSYPVYVYIYTVYMYFRLMSVIVQIYIFRLVKVTIL